MSSNNELQIEQKSLFSDRAFSQARNHENSNTLNRSLPPQGFSGGYNQPTSEIKRCEGRFYTSIHELPDFNFEVLKMSRRDRINYEYDSFKQL